MLILLSRGKVPWSKVVVWDWSKPPPPPPPRKHQPSLGFCDVGLLYQLKVKASRSAGA